MPKFLTDNWKTTVGGWAFAAIVILAKLHAKQPLDTQTILLAAGFAGVGSAMPDPKK